MKLKFNVKLSKLLIKSGLKSEELESNFGFYNDDREISIDHTALSKEFLTGLEKWAKENPKAEYANGVMQSMSMIKSIEKDIGGKFPKRLDALEEAIKLWIAKDHINFYLYRINDTGFSEPYLVTNVRYHPKTDKDVPAVVVVSMKYIHQNRENSHSLSFYYDDLQMADTIRELFSKNRFYHEDENMTKKYEGQVAKYKEMCTKFGTQYLAEGYGQGDYSVGISMTRDGKKAKVVQDFEMKDGLQSVYSNITFWNFTKTEKNDDKSTVVPVHTWIKVFDLHVHRNFWCHVDNLTEYVYNPELINLLILPEEIKEIVGILSESVGENIEDIIKGKSEGIFMLLKGPPGTGKCHGKGTKILMADGSIKNVEDIKNGEKLMGDDSKPRIIKSLARGKEEIFEISPLDGGTKFTINRSHIMVFIMSCSYGKYKKNDLVEIPFGDYLKMQDGFKHYAKLIRTKIEFKNNEKLDIDPYFLGLWLGDGDWRHPHISVNEKEDKEIVGYLHALANQHNLKITIKDHKGKSGLYTKGYQLVTQQNINLYNNPLTKFLDKFGCRNKEKSISITRLLKLSINDRKKILAGYVDSDGGLAGNGCYEISSKRIKLLKDMEFLARSVGYAASFKMKTVKWTGNAANHIRKDGFDRKGIIREYGRLHISGAYDLPVICMRKKSKDKKINKNCLVTGFTYKSLGIDDYYGFSISGNRRYLLSDTTITHNTLTAEVYSEVIKKPLYSVQSAQLGVDPLKLEENLKAILGRAQAWGAILHIDEVDVYMRERGDDLMQNAIVGVWLRTIEYYRGMLIATTNKDTAIDDAIKSRANAIIQYPVPDENNARRIWNNLVDENSMKFSKGTVDYCITRFPKITGRSMKNIVSLSKKLMKRKNVNEITQEIVDLAAIYTYINGEDEKVTNE